MSGYRVNTIMSVKCRLDFMDYKMKDMVLYYFYSYAVSANSKQNIKIKVLCKNKNTI